ncbi:LysR substrate-binding domain-containing protein [Vibrio methylphosphonaticus]|uniref:LysR substrate-binding domain-containing protein n=1 Tax=Vibrio methylphosphonaticus TaxID=2946866 RepID=UPI00202A8793|nr:LysR substrate-binding domain-containing protein [Vibrio methylphosphonaticus]MCL9773308.1 LysR substrate-binding domain-containing protein [Vibrio methylphosphonaticus]
MKERLPPLQGLYYFYMAVEKGSFKEAAKALFVSAAAVSQQIRLLEQNLGVALFHREHRKVRLTSEGELLFNHTQKGIVHLQQGVRLINQDPNPNRLSISTLPSFAQHWLVPRLQGFREVHPNMAILLEPTNQLVTFQDSSVDISIRYGEGSYPNIRSEHLMDDIIYPVCHPLYQEKHGIYTVDDLSQANLIEDTWPDMDWNLWLNRVGGKLGKPTLQYNGSHFVLEGALAVQGVALIKHSLAYRYIQEGTLVRIGDRALRPKFSYYLCAPDSYFNRKKITIFSDWMKEQVLEFQSHAINDLEIIETDYTLRWNKL